MILDTASKRGKFTLDLKCLKLNCYTVKNLF